MPEKEGDREVVKKLSKRRKRTDVAGNYIGKCCEDVRPPRYSVVEKGGPTRYEPRFCCVWGYKEWQEKQKEKT